MSPIWKRKDVRSGFEQRIRKELDEKAISYTYEKDKLKYVKDLCPKCNEVLKRGTYTPDFTITNPDGIRWFLETKGRFTARDRKKMELVKRSNPSSDIRFLFQRDHQITARVRYSDWARQRGFGYAIGETVPNEWLGVDSNEVATVKPKRKYVRRKAKVQ